MGKKKTELIIDRSIVVFFTDFFFFFSENILLLLMDFVCSHHQPYIYINCKLYDVSYFELCHRRLSFSLWYIFRCIFFSFFSCLDNRQHLLKKWTRPTHIYGVILCHIFVVGGMKKKKKEGRKEGRGRFWQMEFV